MQLKLRELKLHPVKDICKIEELFFKTSARWIAKY